MTGSGAGGAWAGVPTLHMVTTDDILARSGWLQEAKAVLRAAGARGALQLRGHETSSARLLEFACALRPVAEETGGWLVVNDRIDVALAADVDAVQLTSRSLLPADARAVVPRALFGCSVHSVEETVECQEAGAAWVVAGHIFPTPSHPGDAARGVAALRSISARATVPVIAIGGVFPRHVSLLRAAGAGGVATIRGVWGAKNAERAVFDYLTAYDESQLGPGNDADGER